MKKSELVKKTRTSFKGGKISRNHTQIFLNSYVFIGCFQHDSFQGIIIEIFS